MENNIFLKNENIEVYTPCSFETNIKGYWLDNDGKLYIDNILIQKVNELQYQTIKKNLYNKGEKAIFYIQNEKAYIENLKGIETLTKKQTFKTCMLTDTVIKMLCKEYNGITVFKNNDDFIVETWTK